MHKTSESQFHGGTLRSLDSSAADDGGSGGWGAYAVVITVVVHVLFRWGQGVREGAIREVEVNVVGYDADVVHDGVDRREAVLQCREDSTSRWRERMDGDARLQNPKDTFQETTQASNPSSCQSHCCWMGISGVLL